MPLPGATGLQGAFAQDALDGMVQDWLFLVLRYAVSRESADRQAILELAGTMDALGKSREQDAFRFFRSQSERLCGAIAAPDTPGRRQMLMAHARRIGQPRLQQMFMLACHLDAREKSVPGFGRTDSRADLWKGLQRRG